MKVSAYTSLIPQGRETGRQTATRIERQRNIERKGGGRSGKQMLKHRGSQSDWLCERESERERERERERDGERDLYKDK